MVLAWMVCLAAGCGRPAVADVSSRARPPIPAAPSPSPTGRTPRLLWTPHRQATWTRMVREGETGARTVRRNCSAAEGGRPRYGDTGLWCALWFQFTGDVRAARAAWRLARPGLTAPPTNANAVREQFLENAILFDWLYPALTDSERTEAIDGLNAWARYALAIGTPQYVGGIRPDDSDALVGYYFGLAATDIATRDMPGHVAWLEATQETPVALAIGGLDPTQGLTARNAIAALAAGPGRGGEWVESSEYNLGTLALMALGVAALRPAVGDSAFSDIQRFLRAAAEVQLASVTSDLRQAVQWGDNEHPRGFVDRLFRRRTLLGILAGTLAGSSEAARLTDLSNALGKTYGESGYRSAEPWARYYLLFDPYALTSPWQGDSAATWAPGMGSLYVRTGRSLAWISMSPWPGVDHAVHYLADVQLYRDGEWALTRPMGYAGAAVGPASANGMLLSGFGAMGQKGPLRYDHGPDWWAVTGSTGGPRYQGKFWDPPPAFLDEWRRTVIFLERDQAAYFVFVDWLDMVDPRGLPKLGRYRKEDQATIAGRSALIAWLLHTPMGPVRESDGWRWQADRGQPATLTTLGAAMERDTVIDETSLWQGSRSFKPSEPRYQLRLLLDTPPGERPLRHVVRIGDGPRPVLDGETIRIGSTRIVVTREAVSVTP